jgi:hypothetical protein
MLRFVPQPHPRRMSLWMMRGHLRFLHGTHTFGSEPLADLYECHKIRHADPDPPYDVEHDHEPLGRSR